MRFHCSVNDDGKRIDRVMRQLFPDTPLSAISKALRRGMIKLDNRKARFSDRVSNASIIECRASFSNEARAPAIQKKASRVFPLFEDEHLATLYKPSGLALSREFIADIQSHFTRHRDLSFRPSPVHRLDRNTSGLLMISKTVAAARVLGSFFRERKVRKEYLALLGGSVSSRHVWDRALLRLHHKTYADTQGKAAKTIVEPIAHCSKYTLARCTIVTGRTHQIRAHAAAYGHPLYGDTKYGGEPSTMGYTLHAYRVDIPQHDLFSQNSFTAPLRDCAALKQLWGTRIKEELWSNLCEED